MSWNGHKLSPEQLLVLERLAILFLRQDRKRNWVDFTHELIEGRLKFTSKGLFVVLAGAFFTADLGMINDEKWSVDFFIPKGSEDRLLDIERELYLTYIRDGEERTREVDQAIARVSEVSLLD